MLSEAEVWEEYRACFRRASERYYERTDEFERIRMLEKILQFPLHPVRIVRYDQSLTMLAIRNQMRATFSSQTESIRVEDHTRWWNANKDTMHAYLFLNDNQETVGYTAIYMKDEKYWSTVAILPQFSGHGYGRFMLHFIINQIEGEVWATARCAYPPAGYKLHVVTDWEMWKDDGELLHFRTWKGRPK